MGRVEDSYFTRIGEILDVHVPSAQEGRVFRLETGNWDTVEGACEILISLGRKKEQLSALAEEIGEAELRYQQSLFNKSKALECKAVLMTLAQILPALSSMEVKVAEWIDKNDTPAK